MEGSGWKLEGLEWVDRSTIDAKLLPLLDVVEGRLPIYLNCETPMDVLHGLAIAKENGFLAQTVLMIGASCWKVSDQIKEAGVRGVVLPLQLEHTERAPFAEEDTVTLLPEHFAEKGIPFALRSANSTTESLWYQAARCVALGVDRQQALEAITTMPADLIGLGSDVGSLEPGHHANIVLLSGDPLSLQSTVQYVFVEGRMIYDRSQDTRLQPARGRGARGRLRRRARRHGHPRGRAQGRRGDPRHCHPGASMLTILPLLLAAAPVGDAVLVRAGTIHLVGDGTVLKDGALLIEDGKIVEVGTSKRRLACARSTTARMPPSSRASSRPTAATGRARQLHAPRRRCCAPPTTSTSSRATAAPSRAASPRPTWPRRTIA